jgi:hypothetical protein
MCHVLHGGTSAFLFQFSCFTRVCILLHFITQQKHPQNLKVNARQTVYCVEGERDKLKKERAASAAWVLP